MKRKNEGASRLHFEPLVSCGFVLRSLRRIAKRKLVVGRLIEADAAIRTEGEILVVAVAD
jgi:hypothetical protein